MTRIMTLIIITLTSISFSYAESLTGRQIIEHALENNKGAKDMVQTLKMVLIDEKGRKTERDMQLKAMTDDKGNSYTMSVFTAPSREKGISLLTVAKKAGSTKQYLYLPSNRRVKRINSSNKAASFRGSEFTFEDLSDQSPANYNFKLNKEDACGDLQCYVVERTPKGSESSYSKTLLWIDKTHFRPMQAEFYDKDGKLLKAMSTVNYTQAEGKYWSPEKIIMTNKQTGKSTELITLKLDINNGLKTSAFTELAMKSFR